MADHAGTARPGTLQLVLVPSIITLAILALRTVGELQHWNKLLFNTNAGGGFALVGISWLPFIFGPYFAMKLLAAGDRPPSNGKVIGFALLGFVLMVVGGVLANLPAIPMALRVILGVLLMAFGGLLPLFAWPSLFKTLIAYGYAARIPVAIIMYFAIAGSWGTHYDALPPNYPGPSELWPKYAFIGLVPQLVIWPAFTSIVGSLAGGITAAVSKRGKTPAHAAA